jgi:fructose-1,6-bisphosphatase/inositol monophosphatase family enzyme
MTRLRDRERDMLSVLAELCDWLLELQRAIQHRSAEALQQQTSAALARVAREGAGDTIYEIDQGLDDLIGERCRQLSQRYPFVLIAEGDTRIYPAGAAEETALFRLVVDPLDGTRGIMYDKRSAWTLAGIAPNLGPATTLADIVLAAQTEIPTTKQYLADTLWAVRGQGVRATRRNLLTGEVSPIVPQPSQAPDLSHGFAMLSKFFPGRKPIVAEIEERLYARLGRLLAEDRVRVFDDQYISTGGQLYELAVGHDRFNGDIRAALVSAAALPGHPPGLTVHPYDICTELIAREAGVIVTDLQGRPLLDRLSEDGQVSWLAYANRTLQARIEPILQELFRDYGLL